MNVTALVQGTPGHQDLGEVVERYLYDPYGTVTFLAANWTSLDPNESAYANDILFAGYRFNYESRHFDARLRPYTPITGRFASHDRFLQYVDNFNLYEYVRSNPAAFLDPLGACQAAPRDDATKTRLIKEAGLGHVLNDATLEEIHFQGISSLDFIGSDWCNQPEQLGEEHREFITAKYQADTSARVNYQYRWRRIGEGRVDLFAEGGARGQTPGPVGLFGAAGVRATTGAIGRLETGGSFLGQHCAEVQKIRRWSAKLVYDCVTLCDESVAFQLTIRDVSEWPDSPKWVAYLINDYTDAVVARKWYSTPVTPAYALGEFTDASLADYKQQAREYLAGLEASLTRRPIP